MLIFTLVLHLVMRQSIAGVKSWPPWTVQCQGDMPRVKAIALKGWSPFSLCFVSHSRNTVSPPSCLMSKCPPQ
ncbi:hypothetical protein QBC43DRAFT_320433 [Cladorrhinum sp. PSN259]|nr:hypothetical protein QBC43DRAFT_320433 [Cladorrhinum sp. PSN259]